MFMRIIFVLSLSAFALAVPVAQPQSDDLTVRVAGAFCSTGPIHAFCQVLDRTNVESESNISGIGAV
jgi:hypothetical protein